MMASESSKEYKEQLKDATISGPSSSSASASGAPQLLQHTVSVFGFLNHVKRWHFVAP
jgi:hypothetical protein